MIDLNQLRAFKKKASSAGYESESSKKIKESDGSTTIWYESGDWSLQDNYFGGEPYGGRTVICYQKKPFWIMVYYGAVYKEHTGDEVYQFLRKALRARKEEEGFRGPREFKEGKFVYKNSWQGTLEEYSGKEEIYENGKLIYSAIYVGGLVDQRVGD